MRRSNLGSLGVGVAIVLAGLVAFYAPVSRPQGKAPVTLDDQITYDGPNLGDIPKPDCIEIAPVSAPDSMTPGSWTGVSDSIFSSILARTGIIPGQTDPDNRAERKFVDDSGKETVFPGAPGLIDNLGTDNSLVLNGTKIDKATGQVIQPPSKRMTFGYFVRITQTIAGKPITREFFLLMSYDYIDAGTPGSNPSAFEVFVFGPLPTPGMYAGANPEALLPLQDGLAVNGAGILLDSVPLNIAKQNNVLDNLPANTPVTPGVEGNEGCFACHADRKGGRNSSPVWTMTFGQFQAAYQTRGGKIDCPPPGSSVLQNAVLQGNVLQQGVLPGGGDSGGSQGNGVLNGIGVNPPAPNQPNTRGGEGGDEGGQQQTPGHPPAGGEGQHDQPGKP
jgi:hypothetical protein